MTKYIFVTGGVVSGLGKRLDGDLVLSDPLELIEQFPDAADAIAAHLSLAAVGIEHPHLPVRDPAPLDEDDPVAADGKMAVGEPDRELPRVFDRFVETVEIDIVVADAVQLIKRSLHSA